MSFVKNASILCVLLALFIDNVGYCFVVPFLPQHAAGLGMSRGMIGILFGLYGVMLFLGSMVFRRLVSSMDRRIILVSGTFCLCASFVLFAKADSMYMLFAARALEGLAGSAIQTAGTSLLKGYYTPEQEDRPMALIFLVMSIGGLLGPPFGGLLHEFGTPFGGVTGSGWAFPFWVMACFTLAVALPAACILTENDERPPNTPMEYLFHKQIIGTLIAVFLVGYSTTQLEPILPLYLSEHFGTKPITIGCMMMVFTLAHAGSSPAANYLEQSLGRVGVSAIGLAISAIFIPLLPMANSLWTIAAVLIGTGMSGGLVLAFAMPELAEVLSSLGHTSHVTVYVMFDSAYAGGMVTGSICGGMLFERGIKWPLISVAIMMLCHAPILYALASNSVTVGAVTRTPAVYEAVCMMDDEESPDSWEVSRFGNQGHGDKSLSSNTYQSSEYGQNYSL